MATRFSSLSVVGISDLFRIEHLRELFHEYIVRPLAGITVTDVLDILVLFLLIWAVWRFIRQRRAGKLALGLLLIMVLALVSRLMNLRAVNRILQDFYQIGILAIIVIFQPELRDALEKMGNTSANIVQIGGARRNAEITALIAVLSEAASTLSKERTGALIIIERGTKLGEFVTTGVEIDAVPSTALIRNIFFNKSPLHDGAVVIRDCRVCAAGCILPTSRKEAAFMDMGTRHRAAIGITEISDAVVIVVSEETGIISIANNGIIKRDYDSGSLKEDLFLLLAGSPYDVAEAEVERAEAERQSADASGEKTDAEDRDHE